MIKLMLKNTRLLSHTFAKSICMSFSLFRDLVGHLIKHLSKQFQVLVGKLKVKLVISWLRFTLQNVCHYLVLSACHVLVMTQCTDGLVPSTL